MEFTFTMSNDELAAAISRTHVLLKRTGPSYEYFAINVKHLRELLEIEVARASQVKISLAICDQTKMAHLGCAPVGMEE